LEKGAPAGIEVAKREIGIEFIKECLTFTGEDSPIGNLLLSVLSVRGVSAGLMGSKRALPKFVSAGTRPKEPDYSHRLGNGEN
jgi:hypothetical protein